MKGRQTYFRNPLARLMPLPKAMRERLLGRARSALDMLTMTKMGGDAEAWRDLADVVNVIETMAAKCKLLTPAALEYTQAANEAMKASQARYKQGKALRLDGAGIEAIRAVLEIYGQCLELLTERQIEGAFKATQEEVKRLIASGVEAVTL